MDRKYNKVDKTHPWSGVWLAGCVEGLSRRSRVAIDPISPVSVELSSYSKVMYVAGYKPFFIGY